MLGSTVPAGRAAGPCGPVPSCGASVGAFLMPPSHLDLDHRRDPCGIPLDLALPDRAAPRVQPSTLPPAYIVQLCARGVVW